MKLAIQGHPTRGKEVIKLLEMMGGKNVLDCSGHCIKYSYYVCDHTILYDDRLNEDGKFEIFNLEEFLEKFPYKVGDRVISIYGKFSKISELIWSERDNKVRYALEADVDSFYYASELQPYKEETMEEKENSVVVNIEHKQLKVHSLRFDKTQLMINDEYELKQEGDAYYIVRKKKEYPKTYEECCEILDVLGNINIEGYKKELLLSFQKLLICRDTYWKIVGEQMRLDKPWDSTYGCGEWGYWIGYDINENKIYCQDSRILLNHLLVFPTEEMRNAFYENFRDLIETCKELL